MRIIKHFYILCLILPFLNYAYDWQTEAIFTPLSEGADIFSYSDHSRTVPIEFAIHTSAGEQFEPADTPFITIKTAKLGPDSSNVHYAIDAPRIGVDEVFEISADILKENGISRSYIYNASYYYLPRSILAVKNHELLTPGNHLSTIPMSDAWKEYYQGRFSYWLLVQTATQTLAFPAGRLVEISAFWGIYEGVIDILLPL